MDRSLVVVGVDATTGTTVPMHEGAVQTCTPGHMPHAFVERKAFVAASTAPEVAEKRTNGSA